MNDKVVYASVCRRTIYSVLVAVRVGMYLCEYVGLGWRFVHGSLCLTELQSG